MKDYKYYAILDTVLMQIDSLTLNGYNVDKNYIFSIVRETNDRNLFANLLPRYEDKILDKLCKDEMLDTETINNQVFYKITFKGLLRIDKGGYEGIMKTKDAKSIRLDSIENAQKWGTWILAFGTLGLLLFEALKFLFDYF